jgi:hypothetical protein
MIEKGRDDVLGTSAYPQNIMAGYVPSTTRLARNIWLHLSPELASIQLVTPDDRSRMPIFMINFVAKRLGAGLDCFPISWSLKA